MGKKNEMIKPFLTASIETKFIHKGLRFNRLDKGSDSHTVDFHKQPVTSQMYMQ